MRSVVMLLGILLALSLANSTVNACDCRASGAPCEAYGSADAVFVGTVVGVREEETPEESGATGRFRNPSGFKFSVEQSYLGVAEPEIEVFTSFGAGNCGYEFQMGQRYLVYAYRQQNKLTTHTCTRTRTFSYASEDLEFLGKLTSAPPGVTIYGGVGVRNLDNKTLSLDILIVIEGESVRKEVHLDAKGQFRASGLPAGKYKVSLQLPETLTSDWPLENEIEVSDHGCAAVGWPLKYNGRVSGRVVNADGEAIPRIHVSLLQPGTDFKTFFMLAGVTDKEGNFSLSRVPPGRYLIAVNYNHYPELEDPNNAYIPTFYPGVIDDALAQVITLGAGEKLEKFDIRVPSKRPESILTGSVVWSDGSPVADARLSVMDVTLTNYTVPAEVVVDGQGRFRISGYAGQKLIIEAWSNRPNRTSEEPMERAEEMRITLQRPVETVQIVITKLR